MRASSSRPFFPKLCKAVVLDFGEDDQNTTGSVVQERCAHRTFPPALRPRRALVVAQHDQVRAYVLGGTADFLHRLAYREVAHRLEALVGEGLDALVEHGLSALFLF